VTAVVAAPLLAERELLEAALRDAIPESGPVRHYDLVADYPRRGGKRMRPMLCLAACRLYGGASADALPAAVALELLHSAFLVHDDIEDGSTRRRGQPTLHEALGVARAINVGDALCALAFVALAKGSRRWAAEVAAAVTTEFAHLLVRTTEGQATELAWIAENQYDLGDGDYLALIRDKTCWYSTSHPLRIGALIGSRGRADVSRLNDFGFYVGAIFQINDDIENLQAGGSYGKDALGDVLEGKPTLPLLHLLRSASPKDRELAVRNTGPRGQGTPEERTAIVRELMDRYGSIEHARRFIDALSGLALTEFRKLFSSFPREEPMQFLYDLVIGIGMRNRSGSAPDRRTFPDEVTIMSR